MRTQFGGRLLENEPLRRYTTARVGGPAAVLLVADSAIVLAGMV